MRHRSCCFDLNTVFRSICTARLRVLCDHQTLNLARQGRNQTCREWQVACGKWQAKKSSRLATKFRPSSTERAEHLRDLSVEALEAQRPQRTSHWLRPTVTLSCRSSRL